MWIIRWILNININLKHCNENPSADYMAVYAVMEAFEKENYETRLIIWFDN